jgi:predicted dehydrogenase
LSVIRFRSCFGHLQVSKTMFDAGVPDRIELAIRRWSSMSSSKDRVRVGLIGYGYAGKTFHAPLIRSVPELDLVVVGSTKRSLLERELPSVRVCSAAEAAVHEDVELVVVASPNDSHFPLASLALRAGKDVVLDKPFTVSLSEARELRQIAEEHKRLLSVFHNRRWESEVQATKSILDSGLLGEVSHYECHMDRFRPVIRDRWRENPGPGAGLWFDLGPHLIDQALYLFGLPQSVSASLATLRSGGQTDDWAHIQLNYPDTRVILHATLLSSGGSPRSIVHGTKATWVKYGADTQEAQLKAGMQPDDPAFGEDSDPGILYDGATGTITKIAAPAGNQRMYYVGIRDSILRGVSPPISARDAVTVMAILEASFESAARGAVVSIQLNPTERAEW